MTDDPIPETDGFADERERPMLIAVAMQRPNGSIFVGSALTTANAPEAAIATVAAQFARATPDWPIVSVSWGEIHIDWLRQCLAVAEGKNGPSLEAAVARGRLN